MSKVVKIFLICQTNNPKKCVNLTASAEQSAMTKFENEIRHGIVAKDMSEMMGISVIVREPKEGEDISKYPNHQDARNRWRFID
jgi:hypothetical protein